MPNPHASTDRRRVRGRRTRAVILDRAVDTASAEGLDSLSLARLGADLQLSKSGVSGHFPTRTKLQLAVIHVAARLYADRVLVPTMAQPPGLARLWAFCDQWISFMQSGELLGRSFFLTALVEYDARPGVVRDTLVRYRRLWEQAFLDCWAGAESQGQVLADADAAQLFFEIAALVTAATLESQLSAEPSAFDRARVGVLARLRPLATHPETLPA